MASCMQDETNFNEIVVSALRQSLADLDSASHSALYEFSSLAVRGRRGDIDEGVSPYGRGDREAGDEEDWSESGSFYLHNCIVDTCLKLFAKSLAERYQVTRLFVSLMPLNADLLRLHLSVDCKVNSPRAALQYLHDHLSLYQIDDENLWIL